MSDLAWLADAPWKHILAPPEPPRVCTRTEREGAERARQLEDRRQQLQDAREVVSRRAQQLVAIRLRALDDHNDEDVAAAAK